MEYTAGEITVLINSMEFLLASPITVEGVLSKMGYLSKQVVIKRNGVIVPKSEHNLVKVATGDQLEIVIACCG